MNVNDFEAPNYDERDAFIMMWNRQKELEQRYELLEADNGFPKPSGSIDSYLVQDLLKYKAWCVTEELMEMLDAIRNNHDSNHIIEEYIDAFHFTLALLIECDSHYLDLCETLQAGSLQDQLNECYGIGSPDVEANILNCTYRLGMTMHLLKNKRWKSSFVGTDYDSLKYRLIRFWTSMLMLFNNLVCGLNIRHGNKISAEILFDFYFRKSEVNKFRQRSQY